MSRRLLTSIGVLVAVIALVKFAPAFVAGQSSASGDPAPKKETAKKAGPAPRTPWGEPDLQGIWTDEYQTPLQRPARFANREFFTEEERAELDARRGAMIGRDRRGAARSERDVAGAYNAVFESVRPTGRHTRVWNRAYFESGTESTPIPSSASISVCGSPSLARLSSGPT